MEVFLDLDKEAVVLANRRLGISETETSPGYWDPGWDNQPLEKFLFRPGHLAERSLLEKMTNRSFGPVTPDLAAKGGDLVLKGSIQDLLSDPKERKQALEALEFVQSPANAGKTFRLLLSSHPLTRVVNVLRRDILKEGPLFVLDADQNAWAAFQNDIGRQATVLMLFQKLRKAPAP